MVLNLKQLYQNIGEKLEINYQVEQTELSKYKGVVFSTPVTINGTAANRAGIVTLSYTVDFAIKHCCDRCLIEFEPNYSFKFEHIVVNSLNTDTDEYILSDGDKLELDELVMSDLLLQLPTKILCKEDCKGLCPVCGADLNETECNCK